jgi:hypothetical protein
MPNLWWPRSGKIYSAPAELHDEIGEVKRMLALSRKVNEERLAS